MSMLAGHHYVFTEGSGPRAGETVLLLHGTGGDEHDLLPLGRALAPGAALLSPRGNVLEHGMPRFFRRLAEGVFDQRDLAARTDALADFVREAVLVHRRDIARLAAVGLSNGANIAASLLLRHPGLVRRAVLFRAMIPFEPAEALGREPDLTGTAALLANGRTDPLIPAPMAERLAAILRGCGADVTLIWQPGGHTLGHEDIDIAAAWLASSPGAPADG